jgi:Protein of unknown function (DUF2795)
MDVNPIDVQKHLKGVSYPASRDDLVSAAESNGAPAEIVSRLRELDRDRFDGPDEVMKDLGGGSG